VFLLIDIQPYKKVTISMALDTIQKVVGIIVTGSGGIAALWFKFGKPYFNKRKMLKKETAAALMAIHSAIPKINLIYAEMTPNGGGSIKDVISQMQASQAKSEKMTRLALNEQAVSFYECDQHGLIIYASSHLYDKLGRGHEEMIGQNWMSIIHPNDRNAVLEDWEDSIDSQRNFEHRCRLLNGDTKKYMWVIITKTPILTGKRLVGFYGVIRETAE
jgi:PAS domain S-box-containing protein